MTELIVLRLARRGAQYLVRLVHVLESSAGIGFFVAIGMELERLLAKRLF